MSDSMPFSPEVLAELPVEPVGLAVLLLDLLERKPAGVVRRLRVVRHPEILEAALARGVRHRLQRLGAVGRVGVTVQDPAQVAVGDQFRQNALQRPFDLVAPLAQFGLDEREVERLVDVLLPGCHEAPAFPEAVGLERHPLAFGERP
jgi:hypothetical protein